MGRKLLMILLYFISVDSLDVGEQVAYLLLSVFIICNNKIVIHLSTLSLNSRKYLTIHFFLKWMYKWSQSISSKTSTSWLAARSFWSSYCRFRDFVVVLKTMLFLDFILTCQHWKYWTFDLMIINHDRRGKETYSLLFLLVQTKSMNLSVLSQKYLSENMQYLHQQQNTSKILAKICNGKNTRLKIFCEWWGGFSSSFPHYFQTLEIYVKSF